MICGQSEGLVEHLRRPDKDHQQAYPDDKEEAEHKRLCPIQLHRHGREAIKHPAGFWGGSEPDPARARQYEPSSAASRSPHANRFDTLPTRRRARDDLDVG
jgi:hypothetical protein